MMMEKRRIVRHNEDDAHSINPPHPSYYGNPTIVNYNSSPIVNVINDADSEEKKNLYNKPRFIAVLLSALILIGCGMFVMSRSDILHIALFHHTADYHANNHVVDKIEEHKGVFVHEDRDIDASPSSAKKRATSNINPLPKQPTQSSSGVNKNKRNKNDPVLSSLGFEEQEFDKSTATASVKQTKVQVDKPKTPQKLRQTKNNNDNSVSVDSSLQRNSISTDSSLPVADVSDTLKTDMEAQIAVVRKMKYEDHIVMEVDEKAKVEIAKLQDLVRKYIIKTYGEGPHYLEMELEFPKSMELEGRNRKEKLIIELAPIKLVPYSVYYFLQLVENWKGGAFHRNAGHVLQAFIAGGRAKTPSLAFQEYHPGFPHVKHTMGYAGRPGGPEFYISTVDNSDNHGPGSQGSKTEADGCFGRIVKGIDVVQRMKKQPGAGGAGFIDSPDNYIRIPSLKIIRNPEL